MKTMTLTALLACLASCAAVPSASQAPPVTHDNRISLYLGQRNLDESDYAPVDEQVMFGIEFAQESTGSPVGFEVGIMGSGDETNLFGFNVKASTGELYGGVRKSFGGDVLRPYLGAGLSFITSTFEVQGAGSDDDSSLGLYIHGGLALRAGEAVVLGIDARGLFGTKMTLFGVDTDADYGQLALFVGFQF